MLLGTVRCRPTRRREKAPISLAASATLPRRCWPSVSERRHAMNHSACCSLSSTRAQSIDLSCVYSHTAASGQALADWAIWLCCDALTRTLSGRLITLLAGEPHPWTTEDFLLVTGRAARRLGLSPQRPVSLFAAGAPQWGRPAANGSAPRRTHPACVGPPPPPRASRSVHRGRAARGNSSCVAVEEEAAHSRALRVCVLYDGALGLFFSAREREKKDRESCCCRCCWHSLEKDARPKDIYAEPLYVCFFVSSLRGRGCASRRARVPITRGGRTSRARAHTHMDWLARSSRACAYTVKRLSLSHSRQFIRRPLFVVVCGYIHTRRLPRSNSTTLCSCFSLRLVIVFLSLVRIFLGRSSQSLCSAVCHRCTLVFILKSCSAPTLNCHWQM